MGSLGGLSGGVGDQKYLHSQEAKPNERSRTQKPDVDELIQNVTGEPGGDTVSVGVRPLARGTRVLPRTDDPEGL